MMITDALMILVAFAGAMGLRALLVGHVSLFSHEGLLTWNSPADFIYLAWFTLSFLLVARHHGIYTAVPTGSEIHEIRLMVQASLSAGLLLCGALYIFHAEEISRLLVMLLVLTASVTLSARRVVWRASRNRQFAKGIELRNVLIVGTNQLSYAMSRDLQDNYRLGYRFVGFVRIPGGSAPSNEIDHDQILGAVDSIRNLARKHFVDEIVIAEAFPTEQAIQLVEEARELDVNVRVIAGFYRELSVNAPVDYLGMFPVTPLHRTAPRTLALLMKRMVDVVVSLALILAVLPICIVIAIAVRLDSPGPIFYVSERIGKRGRVFRCFKFRTMVPNAERLKKDLAAKNERDSILFKLTNDPRVTRVGRILRKYSLDELPQFLNVLSGEMSLVGPRPPIASEVEKYKLEHFRRLEVLPGLTGLWQVTARGDASFQKYIELDTAYVENWSLGLDLKILVRTAEVVFRGTGV